MAHSGFIPKGISNQGITTCQNHKTFQDSFQTTFTTEKRKAETNATQLQGASKRLGHTLG